MADERPSGFTPFAVIANASLAIYQNRLNSSALALEAAMLFPEEKLWDEINDGWSRMSFKQRNLWEVIKRTPEEWTLKGYGPCWVVALIGETVIYYNHFEHGFNRSPWSQFGIIDYYQSLQSGLEEAVQMQLNLVNTGYDVGPWTSGPFAGEYPGR